jgi:hypothetical protein
MTARLSSIVLAIAGRGKLISPCRACAGAFARMSRVQAIAWTSNAYFFLARLGRNKRRCYCNVLAGVSCEGVEQLPLAQLVFIIPVIRTTAGASAPQRSSQDVVTMRDLKGFRAHSLSTQDRVR